MHEPSRSSAVDRLTRPTGFAALLLVAAAVISWLVADRTMPVPDEGALLTAAVKVLHGGVFYRDVDAYAFPGMTYALAGAMALFGEHLRVARALAGGVFCVTAVATYACALTLMGERRAALCGLGVLALKFLAFPIYSMFFYADAAVAAALVALALFLRHDFSGPSMRLFWVGVSCGASIVTKQSTGLLVAIVFAAVLAWPGLSRITDRPARRGAELVSFFGGLLLVVGSMSLYFAAHGVFGEMIRGGLLRPFSGYLPTSGVSFAPPLAVWRWGALGTHGPTYFPQLLFELVLHWTRGSPAERALWLGIAEALPRILYLSIPIAYGLCAGLWIRTFRPVERDPNTARTASLARGRFFSAAGVALAITISAFPRADFIHVVTVYPAVLLILFALGRAEVLGRGRRDRGPELASLQAPRARAEAILVALGLIGTTILGVRYDALLTHRIDLERARIWVKPQHAWLQPLVEYVDAHVPRGEPLFVYGHEAHWYFLTDRYTPRAFSQLYPGMTGDETGEALADLIESTRPRVVLQGVSHWPGMPDLRRYTPALRRTLEELYAIDPRALQNPPRSEMLRIWRLRDRPRASGRPDA